MPRIKSEIAYEQFAQLAEKCGLLKEAYPSVDSYKDDPEARVGSDSLDTIEIMYGVKPDTIDSMEYENNIMEVAHSRSVVIAPSYDKINGLVENNIERSNIMNNIALKPNSATHTNPKYAHQELTLELVRVANEMDARNQADLYELADECLIDLHKEAGMWDEVKKLFGPNVSDTGSGALAGAGIGAALGALLTIWSGPGAAAGGAIGATTGAALGSALLGGAISGGVLGGGLTAFTKTVPQVKNVEENAKDTLEQLSDLEKKVPEQQQFFDLIKQDLHKLVISANKYASTLDELHMAKHVALAPQDIQSIGKEFIQDLQNIKDIHTDFDRRVQAGAFAKAQPGSVLKPIYWFINDDIEDVSKSFMSLEAAADKLMSTTDDAVQTTVEQHAEPHNNEPQVLPKSQPDNSLSQFSKEQLEQLKKLINKQLPTAEDLAHIRPAI